jgi:hypothetical protein
LVYNSDPRIDPYTDTLRCVQRLLKEYQTHKKLIIAVDFDDTVFDFHKKGLYYDGVLNLLFRCQRLGFHLVLWTGSHKDNWDLQKEYLRARGIRIDVVNENPIPLPFGNHGKIYYNLLLDDRAGLGQTCAILEQVLGDIERNEVD